VTGWIGCLVTDAPQDVTARAVAEESRNPAFLLARSDRKVLPRQRRTL